MDDDTVHQNVHYKFMDSIKSRWIYFSTWSYCLQSTYICMEAKHPLPKEAEPVE
jgi:hypothetical protein